MCDLVCRNYTPNSKVCQSILYKYAMFVDFYHVVWTRGKNFIQTAKQELEIWEIAGKKV